MNSLLLVSLILFGTAPAPGVVDAPVKPSTTSTSALSARELLELYGVDESYFRGLVDGRPLHDDESEALLRTVYTLRRLRALDLHRAQRSALPARAIVEDPQQYRGQLARLQGRLKSVTPIQPLPELVQRFELDRYYRCELELDDGPSSVIVDTATIPKAWQEKVDPSARVAAWAFFLKNEGNAESPRPVFVAPRLEWQPATALGDLGVDVSLLDELRNRQRLVSEDRECFYSVLDAMERLDPASDAALPATPETAELARQMFAEPEALAGTRLLLDGVVRRAVRIRVSDPDIIERFGIDHYYELEIFVDVPRLAPAQNPLIHVVCVREVPKDFPLGENVFVRVRVPVFFMKLWSYRSKLADQSGENFRQVAPLCIGREPTVVAPPESSREALGAIAAGIFATLAMIAAWAAWRNRRDDRHSDRRLTPTIDLPPDFGQTGSEALESAPPAKSADEVRRG